MTNPTHYEAFDRPASRSVDPIGLAIATTYRYETTFNKLIATFDATGQTTSGDLDGNGNLIARRVARGATTTYDYDADGFVRGIADAEGRVTTFKRRFDPARPGAYCTTTQTVLGYALVPLIGSATSTTTDVVGNARLIIDANGNEVAQEFDALNRIDAEPPGRRRHLRSQFVVLFLKLSDLAVEVLDVFVCRARGPTSDRKRQATR